MKVGLSSYHLVYKMFGMSISDCFKLDTITFNSLLRDAMCLQYMETREGREYLDECYRLTQTEPDIDKLMKFQQGRIT